MIIDNQELRQTGRTTKALVGMESTDIYITCNNVMARYCKGIRNDVTIHPIHHYKTPREQGFKGRFVFDHAWDKDYIEIYDRLDIHNDRVGLIYLPLSSLIIGEAYRGKGRNFDIAIWNGKTFSGVREKFGTRYMDDEYHYDSDPKYGTFKPLKQLEL